MTPRERIVYFHADEDETSIRARIAAAPHSTYLVCDGDIDQVVGYVDATDLFARMLRDEPISLQGEAGQALLHKVLMVPDRLTLVGRAGAVPAGARGLRRHRQRVQPGAWASSR